MSIKRNTIGLTGRLFDYVVEHGARQTTAQRRLRAYTSRIPMGMMQIGPDQAALMQLIVRLLGAKRCIEIGTFTGYSALAVALALPKDGKIVCCDVSEEWTSVARRYWRMAGVEQKISLKLAPAMETLKKLRGPFDFAFIDADKSNYQNYFDGCLRLLRKGGVIAVDNTLWGGTVLDRRAKDADTRAIRAFNRRLIRDRRVEVALVPIGDGVTFALKR